MTKAQLIARIKTEARISSSDLDTMIASMINEKADNYARIYSYPELEQEHEIVVQDGVGAYDPPEDFLKLLQVKWSPDGDNWTYLDSVSSTRQNVMYSNSSPLWFAFVANKIRVSPYTSLKAGEDYLTAVYTVKPSSLLTEDESEFPVPGLEEKLILEIVARIVTYERSDEALLYQRLAAGENAANFK